MNFENIIERFQAAILEKNQKKIDILCNLYMSSSFDTTPLQTQYEKIEDLVSQVKMCSELSKVSITMVKISILGKMI